MIYICTWVGVFVKWHVNFVTYDSKVNIKKKQTMIIYTIILLKLVYKQ